MKLANKMAKDEEDPRFVEWCRRRAVREVSDDEADKDEITDSQPVAAVEEEGVQCPICSVVHSEADIAMCETCDNEVHSVCVGRCGRMAHALCLECRETTDCKKCAPPPLVMNRLFSNLSRGFIAINWLWAVFLICFCTSKILCHIFYVTVL